MNFVLHKPNGVSNGAEETKNDGEKSNHTSVEGGLFKVSHNNVDNRSQYHQPGVGKNIYEIVSDEGRKREYILDLLHTF